jgi:hypothetical protein
MQTLYASFKVLVQKYKSAGRQANFIILNKQRLWQLKKRPQHSKETIRCTYAKK